jgi:nitrous oxidase accessory protein NosD
MMNIRVIPVVLACVFLLFGTWFISFSLSNVDFSVSNTAMASTRTIYVDGNNAGDPSQDGSSSHPFGTIQKGIDNASAGDTVFVRKGHYYETVAIPNSLNLVGENRDSTIIDAINSMTSGRVVDVLSYVSNVNISGFTIQNVRVNPYYGVAAEWGNSQLNIFGNRIQLCDQGIFINHCSNVTITNNIIANNTLGVSVAYEALNTCISNNTISRIGLPYLGGRGVAIGWYCNYTEVNGNNMANLDWGISIDAGGWEDIIGNTMNSMGTLGLRLNGCFNSTYANNIIQCGYENQGYCGMELLWGNYDPLSENNTFSNNTVEDFNCGMYMHFPYAGEISRMSNNTVAGNTFRNCYQGLSVTQNVSSNNIYHNNFVGNTAQAVDEGSNNFWSEDYPCGGNYWDDYSSSDTHWGENQDKPGSDMMGDTPYLNGTVKDSYPLMEPWPMSDFSSIDLGAMSIGTHSYDLSAAVITSSRTTNLGFDNNTGEWGVRFNVTTDTADSCVVIIPKWLLDGTFNVLVDDVSTACWFDWSNQYHMINITYSSGSHHVRISAEYVKRPLLTQLPDLNGDGKVSLQDLTLLAIHYGQHYP